VSTLTPELIRKCRRCGQELNLGALVCEHCQALVYAQELDRLADSAKVLEGRGQLRQAREQWLLSLRFVPPGSPQADAIAEHARELEQADAQIAAGPGNQVQQEPKTNDHLWAKRFGRFGPLAIFLAKFKFLLSALFKLKFLFSFIAFFGLYWALWGPKFGIGFAVLILIHEMGHYIDVKRRGLPADMPVFLPGFGAYVRWQAMGVSLETRAAVALAGPLAGFLAALACGAVWWQTGSPLWGALARTSTFLNLLNLIPVAILDGGQAVRALSKAERIALLAACLALWLLLGEGMFVLLALGAGYQAFFAGDFPAYPSRKTTVYFIGILSALGLLLSVLPKQGLGGR
jgi:Zn-dependent protease